MKKNIITRFITKLKGKINNIKGSNYIGELIQEIDNIKIEDGKLKRYGLRYTAGIVYYEMSIKECLEMIKAHLSAYQKGGCAADYMSKELEDLLCDVNTRHKIIHRMTDEQIDQVDNEEEYITNFLKKNRS